MKYYVLGQKFKTKKEAHKYLAYRMNQFENKEYKKEDWADFVNLKHIIKMGNINTKNITKIIVYRSTTFNSNHIRYYEDDNEYFFSWSSIFKKKTRKYMIGIAMRTEVKDQIHKYRRARQYILCCDLCHQPSENFEVDHKYAFSKIKKDFILYYPEIMDMKLKQFYNTYKLHASTSDGERVLYEWRKHHKKHATYQMLCRDCNLKKSNN